MRNLRSPLDGPFGRGPFGSAANSLFITSSALAFSLSAVPYSITNIVVGDRSDDGSGTYTLSLTASFGTFTLASTTGLSFSVGDGTADATMTFQGTLANINAAINGLLYSHSAEADVVLTIILATGQKSKAAIVYITVEPAIGDILTSFVVTPISGGTTAGVSISCSESDGTLFVIVVPNGSAVPDAAQIEAGTDGDDIAAIWAAEGGDGVPIASINTWTDGPSGLEQDTSYTAYAVRKATDLSYSNIVSDDFDTTDELPQITVTDTKTGADSATVSITTLNDRGGDVFIVILPAAASNPSGAQIEAGQNASSTPLAGNLVSDFAVSTIGTQTPVNFSGLSGSTAYKAVAVQKDANGNYGTVVAGDGFTTDASETIDATIAANGSGTGWTNSLTAITGSQTDYDGGSNAIQIATTDGANTAYTSLSPAITHYAGMQHVTAYVKHAGSTSPYIRARITNTGLTNANTEVFFRTSDMTIGNKGSLVSGTPTLTSLGSGWYLLDYYVDLTGGDTSGNVQFAFTSTNGGSGMDGTGNEAFILYKMRLGH